MPRTALSQLQAFDHKTKTSGFRFVFGVDEAGRGPLAGPVVAASVWLVDTAFSVPVGDSKKLTARQRERAFHEIYEKARVGVGIISEVVIDRLNILRASHIAMAAAVRDLVSRLPDVMKNDPRLGEDAVLLVDGNSLTAKVPCRVMPVPGGDNISLSIACASIVAKVIRDRIIWQYDRVYPQYGFARHKGYPTAAHREAISRLGPSPIHRQSFTLS